MSLTIRSATAEDATAVRAIYAPVVEMSATSFEETAPTADDMAWRIADYGASHAFLWPNGRARSSATPMAAPTAHAQLTAFPWKSAPMSQKTREDRVSGKLFIVHCCRC